MTIDDSRWRLGIHRSRWDCGFAHPLCVFRFFPNPRRDEGVHLRFERGRLLVLRFNRQRFTGGDTREIQPVASDMDARVVQERSQSRGLGLLVPSLRVHGVT